MDIRARERIIELSSKVDTAFTAIASEITALQTSAIIQEALNSTEADWKPSQELQLYTRFFQSIRNLNNAAAIHISSEDGRRRFSTHEYPSAYDVSNYQNWDRYFNNVKAAPEQIHVAIGELLTQHSMVAMTCIDEGFLILELDISTLLGQVADNHSGKLYLVDSDHFSAMNIFAPSENASFAEQPYLGIVFNRMDSWRPEPAVLVHKADLELKAFGEIHLSLVSIISMGQVFKTIQELLLGGFLLLLLLSILTIFVSYKISKTVSNPVHRLVTAMQASRKGLKPVEARNHSGKYMNELDFLTENYNRMVDTIQKLLKQIQEEEQALRTAELRAIQAQINPHFLYNTLGSIKAMAKLGKTEDITEMVQDLGKIMRFSLTDSKALVPLAESLDQIKRYIHIQQLRFTKRLQVSYDVDPETFELKLPKMLLQPLVENAIVHGVEKTARPVRISLSIHKNSTMLLIQVQDDGPGLHKEHDEFDNGKEPGLGIAMENTAELLRILYGRKAHLKLEYNGLITCAEITIPMEKLS